MPSEPDRLLVLAEALSRPKLSPGSWLPSLSFATTAFSWAYCGDVHHSSWPTPVSGDVDLT